MKKFYNKRLISVLCVLALIVACGSAFAVPVGAWSFDEDPSIDYTGQVELRFQHTMGSIFGFTNYGPGEWPVTFDVTDYEAGSYTPFKLLDLPFTAGYSVAFVWIMPYALIPSNKINFQAPGLQLYTNVIFDAELNFTVENGSNGGVFGDDLYCLAQDTGSGYILFAVQGTLIRDLTICQFIMELPEVDFAADLFFDYSSFGIGPCLIYRSEEPTVEPSVDSVSLSAVTQSPYYPGTDVQLNAEVSGTGIVPGEPESTVYWYVHGNTSADTYIDNDGLLTIANDETASSLEIEAISTYDSTKSATLELPITYPLEGVQIVPSGPQYLTESAKRREIQFSLLLPNGDPFDYQLLEWTTQGDYGTYFRIDDTGLLSIEPNAPAGASCTVRFAYQSDPSSLSPDSVTVQIVTQQEGIYDQLTPTPDQSDKADQMEDAIGDAAGKLENNNSSLEQLTPSRPQLSTDLQLDEENLLAVSPLVTNIWSINGVGRMIGIVIMVATVAYIFFGKRDG